MAFQINHLIRVSEGIPNVFDSARVRDEITPDHSKSVCHLNFCTEVC
jgi:hypothetical protein